jgi:hypothetical protein
MNNVMVWTCLECGQMNCEVERVWEVEEGRLESVELIGTDWCGCLDGYGDDSPEIYKLENVVVVWNEVGV